MIREAGKGVAVIIMAVKDYAKEAYHYRKLQKDPTISNMKLVNDTIERLKKQKLINKKVVEGLKRNDPENTEILSTIKTALQKATLVH